MALKYSESHHLLLAPLISGVVAIAPASSSLLILSKAFFHFNVNIDRLEAPVSCAHRNNAAALIV